jgi:predicted porin
MQKKLMAVAVAGALGAPAVALAQNATVNVYGRLYAEYSYVFQGNRVAENNAPNSNLVDGDFLQNPGSALGFRGEEKLGGGLSAWFQCETSMDWRGQSIEGLCGRNSALGLKGGYGNVWLGNWDLPFKRVMDAVGANDTGVFGTAFLLAGTSTTTASAASNQAVFRRRQNNSIHYDTPNFGGFQASAAYTNLNVSTNTLKSSTGSKPRIYSLSAKYANGPINVYGAYEKHNDITTAAGAGDDDGWVIGGSYTFANRLKFGGMFTRQKWDTQVAGLMRESKVNAWHLGIDWMISGPHGMRASYTQAGDVKGNGAAVGTTRPAAGANTGAQLWQIRYVHALSKRTQFTAGYVKVKNERAARYQLGGMINNAVGNDPSAIAIALDHRF